MVSVTGIFATGSDAARAYDALKSRGIADEKINLLMPNKSPCKAQRVAVTDSEQPGMGKVLGGVVGGVVGAAAGAEMAAFTASLLLPGIGPILAVGATAAAILGVAGAAGGAIVGEALDESLTEGLPVDELFLYEDALRKGRSVVIAFAANQKQAVDAKQLLLAGGAESIDSARESWWLGIRDDEKATFVVPGDSSAAKKQEFRLGFETALKPTYRGKSYIEARDSLSSDAPDTFATEPFRLGYERGQAYLTRQTGGSDTS